MPRASRGLQVIHRVVVVSTNNIHCYNLNLNTVRERSLNLI
ncbi:hypothetical protein [Coleofasciculus sp. FACHB-501]|nr:hypothetical protein [Coleofasciculus sp. FACHB-501]